MFATAPSITDSRAELVWHRTRHGNEVCTHAGLHTSFGAAAPLDTAIIHTNLRETINIFPPPRVENRWENAQSSFARPATVANFPLPHFRFDRNRLGMSRSTGGERATISRSDGRIGDDSVSGQPLSIVSKLL